MPDLVGDLLCILEDAGVPTAIAVGYVAPSFDTYMQAFIGHVGVQDMTGALNLHMRLRASGPTSSQPSLASPYR